MAARTNLLPLIIIVALAPASFAEDTVYLRGGQMVKGKVIDRGSTVVVEHKLGSIAFDRKDVIRIESDAKEELPAVPAAAEDLDTVELQDGKVLRGRVTFSDDGKEIVIATKEIGEARHPVEIVKSIRFKGGRPVGPDGKTPVDDPGSKSLREAIDKHIASLREGDEKAKTTARRELLELAPFAVQYLQSLIGKESDESMRALLSDVVKVRELKSVVTPSIEERVPRVYERLLERDAQKRTAAVHEIAGACPDDVLPLLLHLIKNDPAPSVRSACVGELAILKKFEELAAILRGTDGPLRLAAAFNLGDNGIYAGIPVIIEALRLPDAGLRELANERLRKYTDKEFGFLPSGDPAEREAAVKRWEEWWQKDGQELLKKSLKAWRETEISEEDRKTALDRWRDGNKLLEELDARERGDAKEKDGSEKAALSEKDRTLELERAAYAFKQALDSDPTLTAARISRAIVLYEGLKRFREGEGELRLVLDRFAPPDATFPRKLAFYHLGRILQIQGDHARAQAKYEEAVRIDSDYIEAFVALGDLHLDRAFAMGQGPSPGGAGGGTPDKKSEGKPNPQPATPGEPKTLREQAVEDAIIAYRKAIAAVNRREEALVDVTKDLTSDSPSFPQGKLVSTIRDDRETLEKRAAEVSFRLGRAYAARQDEKMALDAFRAARRLAPNEKRYSDAAALWESLAAPKEKKGEEGGGK